MADESNRSIVSEEGVMLKNRTTLRADAMAACIAKFEKSRGKEIDDDQRALLVFGFLEGAKFEQEFLEELNKLRGINLD